MAIPIQKHLTYNIGLELISSAIEEFAEKFNWEIVSVNDTNEISLSSQLKKTVSYKDVLIVIDILITSVNKKKTRLDITAHPGSYKKGEKPSKITSLFLYKAIDSFVVELTDIIEKEIPVNTKIINVEYDANNKEIRPVKPDLDYTERLQNIENSLFSSKTVAILVVIIVLGFSFAVYKIIDTKNTKIDNISNNTISDNNDQNNSIIESEQAKKNADYSKSKCPEDQKLYDDTRIKLFDEVKKANGNSVLHDEAQDRLTNYARSITTVNNWVAKVESATVISDGTCIIECKDDYKNHPYNLLLMEVPIEIIRKLTTGTMISFSGQKNFDWLNGDFFKGDYGKECSFYIINQ